MSAVSAAAAAGGTFADSHHRQNVSSNGDTLRFVCIVLSALQHRRCFPTTAFVHDATSPRSWHIITRVRACVCSCASNGGGDCRASSWRHPKPWWQILGGIRPAAIAASGVVRASKGWYGTSFRQHRSLSFRVLCPVSLYLYVKTISKPAEPGAGGATNRGTSKYGNISCFHGARTRERVPAPPPARPPRLE